MIEKQHDARPGCNPERASNQKESRDFPMATGNSTTETPRCIGKHARERYKEWLVEDARQRVADALMSPALDCTDPAARMRTNADAAYADLARLDLVQLTLQTVCYASYANELLGLDMSGDDVLGFWVVALAWRGLAGTTAESRNVDSSVLQGVTTLNRS